VYVVQQSAKSGARIHVCAVALMSARRESAPAVICPSARPWSRGIPAFDLTNVAALFAEGLLPTLPRIVEHDRFRAEGVRVVHAARPSVASTPP